MDIGYMMVFASYGWDNCSDARVWDEEIRLARLAADLGFDCLWSAEHHFNDYSFVPDNLQLMTYLTALCPDIDVGTAAVILPWHDPLRVAEWTAHVVASGQGLLMNEIDSWMTGVNRNVEGKQIRRIMRYSGGHPKFRERCEGVAANGYRELSLA